MSTVRRWAETLVEAEDGAILEAIAADPEQGLAEHYGLQVVPSTTLQVRGAGGWCDGVSLLQQGRILYRRTASRRENFTLCHELGHHLADQSEACFDWLADQPESDRLLEQLCDRIASLVLIPSETRGALQDGAVRALDFVDLFRSTNASRSACANAIADALPSEGFAVLVSPDDSDRVFYSSRKGDTRPYPWSGDLLPRGHPVARVHASRECRTFWPYPDGGQRDLYMSAVADDGWVFAIFSDNNIWRVDGGSFVDLGHENRRNDAQIECVSCGFAGITPMWPCEECSIPPCPKCGECDCDREERRVKRGRCVSCTTTVRVALLDDDGLCPNCR